MAEEGKRGTKLRREFSSGGAVFRITSQKPLLVDWLLIRPAGTNRWQLPKGNLDKGEKSEETAIREVFEETGVKARVLEPIGTSQYFYALDGDRIFKTVRFFLMEQEGGGPRTPKDWSHGINKFVSDEIEEVSWKETKEALKELTHDDDKRILKKAFEKVEIGLQEKLF